MNTDRELLELAAKAAGLSAEWVDFAGMDIRVGYQGGMLCGDADSDYYWNPLKSDGDALRLAVELGLIASSGQCWISKHGPMYGEDILPCPYAATRRAIVRAAAEIGRLMP